MDRCDVAAGLIWHSFVALYGDCHTCERQTGGIPGSRAIQVILNVAVVTNTIPNTGITLPFISYGGTSSLFLLAEMGLALSVSRWQND